MVRRLPALGLMAVACIAAMVVPGRAQAATAAPPALKQALDRLVADGVPGAIALQRRGGQERHAASGVANLTTNEPIGAHHRFRIGSITKGVVSTVVLQLAAERRLRLDDTVERWLPAVVPNGDAITVRQLMNHTSGLYSYDDLPFVLQLIRNPLRTWRPRQLVDYAVAHPPLFAPGTRWSYSNTGYILLGMIIAAATGTPEPLRFAAPALEVYRRIVAPLRLWHTSFPLTDPDIHGAHAHGYIIDPPPESGLPAILDTTRMNMSWAWTAGAIVSTLDDVADFHRALFTGRLLDADQQRELQTTVPTDAGADYGLGVYKLQTPCGPAWGHGGSTLSHFTTSLISPDGAHQAALMVNRQAATWTPQISTDYANATITAFCGRPPSSATARSLAATMRTVLRRAG
jgi:D-alanyl-D-alanine carboxypeptidase